MTPQTNHQNLILDRTQIEQKVTRMAYEIYEHNFEEQELVLAGIHQDGYTLAEMLAVQLQQISLSRCPCCALRSTRWPRCRTRCSRSPKVQV